MKIVLTDSEIMVMQILGNLRTMIARQSGVKDMKKSDSSGINIDIDGIIGEYAFCKLKNLFMDMGITPRSGSYDCVSKDGARIDIKSTRHKHGRLIATTKKNQDVDIYVLCIIEGNEVTFPGWCKSSDLFQDENLQELVPGKGNSYVLPNEKLRPF